MTLFFLEQTEYVDLDIELMTPTGQRLADLAERIRQWITGQQSDCVAQDIWWAVQREERRIAGFLAAEAAHQTEAVIAVGKCFHRGVSLHAAACESLLCSLTDASLTSCDKAIEQVHAGDRLIRESDEQASELREEHAVAI